MNAAVVVAAGRGTRMGAGMNKVLLPVCGVPVIVRSVRALWESGLFDGIGHPDSIGLFGHRPSYPLAGYYERLAEALAGGGMYADQNSGAERRCPGTARLGMDPELIRILKKHRVPMITSSDAHRPEDVGYKIRELGECIINA